MLQYEPRVLVVDSIVQSAETVGRHLRKLGFGCVVRGAAVEADFRIALRDFQPHVILAAARSTNGLDAAGALEIARREASDASFLFWGDLQDHESATEILQLGATDFVPRSEPARLLPAIYRALQDVAARRTRRLAEQRIRDSEQRLRDMEQSSQEWLWELDHAGRFLYSSASVGEVLGRSAEQLLGTHPDDLVHGDDAARFRNALAALDAEARIATGLVCRWRNAAGEYRWLEAKVLAVTGATGAVTGFRGTLRDVSEQRALEQRVARLARMLEAQSGISASIVATLEPGELLRQVARLAMQACASDHVCVVLRDRDRPVARTIFSAGLDAGPSPPSFAAGNGTQSQGLAARTLRTGKVSICNDLELSESATGDRERLLALGIRSLVCLPLTVGGATVGALSLAFREAHAVRGEELRLLQDVVASLSFALQSRQYEAAAEFLASYDQLTGLAKRAMLCKRVDALLAVPGVLESRPAIVAFDVGSLGSVNDTFGRGIGDVLLQHVADRLKNSVDDQQRVGYLGGGTFALVLPRLETSEGNVATLLESTVFREPFLIEGQEIRASFKSGIARAPTDGSDGDTLVQHAEAALKLAKGAGKQYLHYQLTMHSETAERVALEHRLRAAIDEQRFELHYQPQVTVATGRIEAVEALLRWNDPEEGLVAPQRFLHVLESSGLIVTVGEWVLRQARADCIRWQAGSIGPVRVAVNVSALQIRRREFVDQVLAAASGWPAGGYGIDIEITETGLLQDLEGTTRKLRVLRDAGVRVAIDDFGTGYSSLGLLSKLPVDLLKIDRAFISGLPDDRACRTLVGSIISLAFAFDLVAVAEGVETNAQLEALRAMKCPQSQGYLHARPMPAAELAKLLAPPQGGV